MANILQFPTEDVQINKLIKDAIQESVGDNPALAKAFDNVANDMRQIIKKINTNPPQFVFSPNGDSIHLNISLLEESVKTMSADFEKIISDILTLLVREKLTVCKLIHE